MAVINFPKAVAKHREKYPNDPTTAAFKVSVLTVLDKSNDNEDKSVVGRRSFVAFLARREPDGIYHKQIAQGKKHNRSVSGALISLLNILSQSLTEGNLYGGPLEKMTDQRLFVALSDMQGACVDAHERNAWKSRDKGRQPRGEVPAAQNQVLERRTIKRRKMDSARSQAADSVERSRRCI